MLPLDKHVLDGVGGANGSTKLTDGEPLAEAALAAFASSLGRKPVGRDATQHARAPSGD